MVAGNKDDSEQQVALQRSQLDEPDPPVGMNVRLPEGIGRRRFRCRILLRVLLVFGLILAVLGSVLVLFYRDVFLFLLKGQLPVRKDSPTLAMYEKPPANARATFYFFNLTNSEEVTFYGDKPVFDELGPYVYRLTDVKEDVEFSDDDFEVSYLKRKHYEFAPDLSMGDENDEIVTLDFVAYGGYRAATEKGQERFGAALLDQANRGRPFKSYKVRNLLWGTHDSLLKVFLSVSPNAPAKPPIFGLMYGKNGTIDSNFTVFTGKGNINQLQMVKEFNGLPRLNDIWPQITDDETYEPYDPNAFRGTLGQSFHPDINTESVLTVFSHDVCFAINFTHRYDSNVEGITTLRFGVDYDVHRRVTGAINRAICDEETLTSRRCALPGVINATRCRDGLPIVMSWPHFLETDYYYLSLVEGLQPIEDKHAPFIDVDPLTGMTLNGAKRIQINFPLKPLPYETYRHLPDFTMFPVMWIEEAATISQEGVASLNEALYTKYRIAKLISYVVLIVGVAMIGSSVLIYFIFAITCAQRLG